MAYEVRLAEYVVDFIEEHVSSERVYRRIIDCLHLIRDYPESGRIYDPSYPAVRPPFPCRYLVVSDTPFVLYYVNDADAAVATVFGIEFAGGDPSKRFRNLS